MEARNKGLMIFGMVLLAIGLVRATVYSMSYPYQTFGIVLVVVGIVFVALGLLLHFATQNSTTPVVTAT